MTKLDANRRPLSPHATIYRWPLNAVLSILHRVTGVGLVVGAILTIWWLLAATTSDSYFYFVNSLLTSFLGDIVLVGSLLALWYHGCNGVRHLIWDIGYGFEARHVRTTGWMAIAATILMTLGTLVIVS